MSVYVCVYVYVCFMLQYCIISVLPGQQFSVMQVQHASGI